MEDFAIVPRDASLGLPSFILSRREGFFKADPNVSLTEWEPLGLPFPKGGEFQLNYYRRNTITFTNIVGQNEMWPVHRKTALGWQVGDPENPTVLEIAIEEDGAWQIYRKENVVTDDEGDLVI